MNPIQEFKALLHDSHIENVLIIPHNMPDGDTLGSCIGLYFLMKHFNKKGYIVLNDDIPSNLSFLLEPPIRIFKSHEVESVKFHMGIAVDCGETKLFEDRIELFKSTGITVNIDHHKTNSYFASVNIVEVEASSTGELVFLISDLYGFSFDAVAAQALYAAIVTDTGSFRYSNTRPETFSVCRTLKETGFDFNRLNVEIFQNKPLEKVLLLNRVFETLKLYSEGRCAVIKLTRQMMEELNMSTYDTDGIVEFIRDISGVEVVVFIRYLYDLAHKVSMRSKYELDVSAIAQQLGGGGHTKAAGFKMDAEAESIEAIVVKAIEGAI